MTYHTLSMQLTKLFEAYCIAVSLPDMVRIRARLLQFAHRARRCHHPTLAREARAAAYQLWHDIQQVTR
jgi:hypothetical protein